MSRFPVALLASVALAGAASAGPHQGTASPPAAAPVRVSPPPAPTHPPAAGGSHFQPHNHLQLGNTGQPGALVQRPAGAPGPQQAGALVRPQPGATGAPGVSGAPEGYPGSGTLLLQQRSESPFAAAGQLLQPGQVQVHHPLEQAVADWHTRVTVRVIAARRSAGPLEIDGRLGPIERDVRSFADQFNYTSYQVLAETVLDLSPRSSISVALPGERSLELEPAARTGDGRLRLHLEVLGPHPEHERKIHTDYSLPRGRTILLGGYRVDPARPDSGTLLLAITQPD